MSSVLPGSRAPALAKIGWIRWLPIALGLLALYGPAFYDLSRSLWQQEEQLHGPIVLAAVVWLIWQGRDALLRFDGRPRSWLGGMTLGIGLLMYVLGRSQDIILFQVGSLIPVLSGAVLAMNGWTVVRRLAFPLFFVLFMLPLPGVIVDALTGPLKQGVSEIAEELLFGAGYPIARSGVMLTIGPYQLLVADACSGLHSLVSITAMGLLYLYLIGHRNMARNAVLVATLPTIAIAANVVRVIVLVLVTFHFGDEAGQGFIHGFSGIFLFVVGLMTLFAVDGAIGRIGFFKDTAGRAP